MNNAKLRQVLLDDSIELKFGKEKPTIQINCIAPVGDNIGSLLLTPVNGNMDWGEETADDVKAELGVFLTFYKRESINILISSLNELLKNNLKIMEGRE